MTRKQREEPEGPGRGLVTEVLREAAERLGDALRTRQARAEAARQGRGLLKAAWGWEQDEAAPLSDGVALSQQIHALIEGREATAAMGRAISDRLLGRWPLKLRCFEDRPTALALGGAEDIGNARVERTERFLACFGVSPDKLPLPNKDTVSYQSAQEYFAFGVVEKQGRG